MEFFGIRLVGITPENGRRLLLSVALVVFLVVLHYLMRGLTRLVMRGHRNDHVRFWSRQAINLLLAIIALLGLLSIWFEDPTRLTTALGLLTAGLAVALQRVVTALAGYFVILRGNTFAVGDRIVMGGVRGDVISLGFMQTTIMEMGEPPPVQSAKPAVWVHSRQFTGRIVRVTNDKIFSEAVYNYTRDFPYIWGEMRIPVPYRADRRRAEEIILAATRHHALASESISDDQLRHMEERYGLRIDDLEPRVYYRLTSNWVELTVRFLVPDHGIRIVEDAISREILSGFEDAKIRVATTSYAITGLPLLRVAEASEGGEQSSAGEPLRP
jgi:small-conductance mechanosensitive channel